MIVLLIFSLLFTTTASAQVKRWTDEKGVTHFESQGSPAAPLPQPRESAPRSATPGKAKVPIERSHAGIRLGDTDSAFRNPERWQKLGEDKFGAAGFICLPSFLPAGVTALTVLSVAYRVSSINVTYNETSLGSWNTVIDNLTKKYGQSEGVSSQAKWADAHTVLSLEKDYRGGIKALIIDLPAVQNYRARAGHDTPKF